MTRMTPPPIPDLTHERSNAMLRRAIRNKVETNRTLHHALFAGLGEATVQKLIRRMTDRGLLKRWRYDGSKSYLRLGQAAIARWGFAGEYYRRLGPQKLPYELGCLSLMTYHDPPLIRLLPHELVTHFAGFPVTKDVQQWAYYRVKSGDGPALATVRVEFRQGGDSVVAKLGKQLHSYRKHQAFDQLYAEGRLILHVVTATADQEAALQAAAENGLPNIELRTSHDPSLTRFL